MVRVLIFASFMWVIHIGYQTYKRDQIKDERTKPNPPQIVPKWSDGSPENIARLDSLLEKNRKPHN